MKTSRFMIMPLLACLSAQAGADCRQLGYTLQEAARQGDVDTASRAADHIRIEPTCPDGFRARAGRVAALAMVREAQTQARGGGAPAASEALLRRSLRYARTWQGLAGLGDLAMDARRYEEATALYQEALSVIDDPASTPEAPAEAVIASVFSKAAESRLLARRYVAVPVNQRSGAPEGLALESVRGWKVRQVPIPITFHTDATELTATGEAAARDLVAYLKRQNPPEITIAGHTDARGSADYNLDLSRRRAEAVAAYLRRNGFEGRIHTRGLGESRPIVLDDPGRYTRDEIWQLNRRVELVRD